MKKPVALIIMDGFGESQNTNGNAIAASNTPNLDKIIKEYDSCGKENTNAFVAYSLGIILEGLPDYFSCRKEFL